MSHYSYKTSCIIFEVRNTGCKGKKTVFRTGNVSRMKRSNDKLYFVSVNTQGLVRPWTVSEAKWSATLFRFSVLQNEKAPQPFEQKKKGLPLQPLLFCDFAPSMLVVCYFDFIVS